MFLVVLVVAVVAGKAPPPSTIRPSVFFLFFCGFCVFGSFVFLFWWFWPLLVRLLGAPPAIRFWWFLMVLVVFGCFVLLIVVLAVAGRAPLGTPYHQILRF